MIVYCNAKITKLNKAGKPGKPAAVIIGADPADIEGAAHDYIYSLCVKKCGFGICETIAADEGNKRFAIKFKPIIAMLEPTIFNVKYMEAVPNE